MTAKRWLQDWKREDLDRVIINQNLHPTLAGGELAEAAEKEIEFRDRKNIKHWITYDMTEDGE